MTPPNCSAVPETQTTGAEGRNGPLHLHPVGGNGEAMRSCGRPLELLVSDFDRFYAVVHRYLLHRLFDIELAEELTAETFYRAATRPGRFPEDPGHARAWLLRTATNLANTHYRKKRLYRLLRADLASARPTVAERSADPYADQGENPIRVRAVLTALRPKYQAVVVLRYYTQLSILEISEVLGCRQDAVRTRLSRALKNMREELGIHSSDQDTFDA